MFRITEGPLSGRLVQCLAKNYKNNSIVFVEMDKFGVMATYSYTVNCTHTNTHTHTTTSVCGSSLKPTGYVMHQQFNIQQLYALPTLYLCVLYLSESKQRLVPLTA